MKRWKILRDHFVRELRKKRKKPSGEAGAEFKSSWDLFDLLTFLTDMSNIGSKYTYVCLVKRDCHCFFDCSF